MFSYDLNDLAQECHQVATSKGWNSETRTFGDLIALMHSELSEALEEFRKGYGFNEIYFECDSHEYSEHSQAGCKPEGIPIELADAIIRILQFCGTHGVDIQTAFDFKMKYNTTRSYRHGGKKI